MIDPSKPASGVPEDAEAAASVPSLRVHAEISDVREVARAALDPLQRLKQLRESKEISPHDFDLNELLQHAKHGEPLRRRDLAHSTGEQALVLSSAELDVLWDELCDCGMEAAPIEYIDRSGKRVAVTEELFSGNVFVLLPEDLGDEEGKPALRVVE